MPEMCFALCYSVIRRANFDAFPTFSHRIIISRPFFLPNIDPCGVLR